MGNLTHLRCTEVEESDTMVNPRMNAEEEGSDFEIEMNYDTLMNSYLGTRGEPYLTLSPEYIKEKAKLRFNYRPDTSRINGSDFSLATKIAAGLCHESSNCSRNINSLISSREQGLCSNSSGFSPVTKNKINSEFLPNKGVTLDTYIGKVFCGIFSKCGDYFLTGSEDQLIRLYDSKKNYKLLGTMQARDVGWSIIDLSINPKGDRFVYSTWSSTLHLCSIGKEVEYYKPLRISKTKKPQFCMFSISYSADGSELIGGANDECLYLYSLERQDTILKIAAHDYDVNAVRFADDSSQILFSGGDDGLIKVWDRRTTSQTQSAGQPVGVFAGHLDGIVSIDARGDGRHLISNSKDQSIKLWDIRVFSGQGAVKNTLHSVHHHTWDYRWQYIPDKWLSNYDKLEGDTSIMTYRGHSVLKTLVRARFSPIKNTGQRYIYTGSGYGDLVIYDALTGKIRKKLVGHITCVRDVAWHPYKNEILTSSWDTNITRWTYCDKEIDK